MYNVCIFTIGFDTMLCESLCGIRHVALWTYVQSLDQHIVCLICVISACSCTNCFTVMKVKQFHVTASFLMALITSLIDL